MINPNGKNDIQHCLTVNSMAHAQAGAVPAGGAQFLTRPLNNPTVSPI
jgi:hypothetical protein